MSGQNDRKQPSLFQTAFRAIKRHKSGAAGLFFLDLLLHGAFLGAVYLWLLANEEEGPGFVWAMLAAALFLFCLIPFRFYAGEKLREFVEPAFQKKRGEGPLRRYGRYFRAGMIRALRGVFWGVPFLTGLGLFLYGMEHLSYTDFGTIYGSFARLIGHPPSPHGGLYVIAGLLILFLLLFLLGWRRDVCMAFLPVRAMTGRELVGTAAKVRERGRGALLRNSLMNLLLLLPAMAGAAGVLIHYAMTHVRVYDDPIMTLLRLWRFVKQPLPINVIFQLLPVALALYLPFLAIRRLRTAALIAGLSPEWNEARKPHAAG